MGNLLVTRDGVMNGMRILAILEEGPGQPILITWAAVQASWFLPDDTHADEHGIVSDFDAGSIRGTLELGFVRPRAHILAVAQLHAWLVDRPVRLTGVASLLHQWVGIFDRDTGRNVGIRMSAAEQDQP